MDEPKEVQQNTPAGVGLPAAFEGYSESIPEYPPPEMAGLQILKKYSRKAFWWVLGIVLGVGGYFLFASFLSLWPFQEADYVPVLEAPRRRTPAPVLFTPVPEVKMRASAGDPTKSEIYLKDTDSGKETVIGTLPNVLWTHYYPAEYLNGNLYVIRRIGGVTGYQNIPDWTDELWRVDEKKSSDRLYFARGFDFRVAPDGARIAVLGASDAVSADSIRLLVATVRFVDAGGTVTKSLDLSVMSAEPSEIVRLSGFSADKLWLEVRAGTVLSRFLEISIPSFEIKSFKVPAGGDGYLFNGHARRIVYTAAASGGGKELRVFNIDTEENSVLAAASGDAFRPVWIGPVMLEYTSPESSERITTSF